MSETALSTDRSAPILLASGAISSATSKSIERRWPPVPRKAEIDDPRLGVVVHHHVGGAQRAMSDAGAMQAVDLTPQPGEQLVGHLFAREIGERRANDEIHDQHDTAIRRFDHTLDPRHMTLARSAIIPTNA
jgi:hypothetical protein